MTNEQILIDKAFDPLAIKLEHSNFTKDKSGAKLVELIALQMLLDSRFPLLTFKGKKSNEIYIEHELHWYESEKLSINQIKEHAQIWKQVANIHGDVNSNYGWCIWSKENHYQFNSALDTLLKDKESRRACMIYNRPSMQQEYCQLGMNDFICTFETQQLIRNNELIYIVNMRSNDAIFGFFNDFAWHCFVYENFLDALRSKYKDLQRGPIIWNANSIHEYERHFKILKQIVS
jgi:thymidylate synthase